MRNGRRAVALIAALLSGASAPATALGDLVPGPQDGPWIRVSSPAPHQWKQFGRVGLHLTRADSIVIRGRVRRGAELTIDEETVALDEDGRFQWELALEEGPRTVALSARDRLGVNRQVLAVIRDSTPPELELVSPSTAAPVPPGRVVLSGRARDPRTKEVLVDGEPARLVGDRWWKTVRLSPQGGEWTVTATDQLGNASRRTFRIGAAPDNSTDRLTIDGLSFQRVNPDTGLEEYRHEQTGIGMVLVPGGAFRMGYEKDLPPVLFWPLSPNFHRYDRQWSDMQRQPAHAVELSRYLIARTELTRAQWERLPSSEAAAPAPTWPEDESDALPAADRSHEDCRRWLDRTLPRLAFPTEAQWEHACRAGTDTDYWTGDELPARWSGFGGWRGEALVVGSLPANPWGLHDVHGNVAEWCEDWFSPYETDFARDPQALTIPPNELGRRVFRGGHHGIHEVFATSWYRDAHDPGERQPTIGPPRDEPERGRRSRRRNPLSPSSSHRVTTSNERRPRRIE